MPHPRVRVALVLGMLLLLASSADAQPRLHVDAALTFMAQSHNGVDQLGGRTWGANVVFGLPVSSRVSVEFEPSLAGRFIGHYMYRPCRSCGPVRVIRTRRDTFFTFQLRWTARRIEPVAGISYIRGATNRDARFVDNGRTYFEAADTDKALAFVGGIDVPLPLARHFSIVPTFRLGARVAQERAAFDVRSDTNAGRLFFRGGAGARVSF